MREGKKESEVMSGRFGILQDKHKRRKVGLEKFPSRKAPTF